jgi:hypothetical protein
MDDVTKHVAFCAFLSIRVLFSARRRCLASRKGWHLVHSEEPMVIRKGHDVNHLNFGTPVIFEGRISVPQVPVTSLLSDRLFRRAKP